MKKGLDIGLICGDKVGLRTITYDDTDSIIKWRNSPDVKNQCFARIEFTAQMHLDWLKEKVEKGHVVQFIILENVSNKAIGSVYFKDIDHMNKSAEFGIFIGEEDMKGKGYGKEATKLILKYGFEVMGLHRVCLRVLEKNVNAYHLYEKIGFKYEGRFREAIKEDYGYGDVIIMSILASEHKEAT